MPVSITIFAFLMFLFLPVVLSFNIPDTPLADISHYLSRVVVFSDVLRVIMFMSEIISDHNYVLDGGFLDTSFLMSFWQILVGMTSHNKEKKKY